MQTVDEAERAILGTILTTSGAALDELALTGDDFRSTEHGDLFDLMRRQSATGRPVETVSLSDAHPEKAELLYSVTSDSVPLASVSWYGDIVSRHSMRRRLSAVGAALMQLDGEDTVAVAEQARKLIDDAIGTTGQKIRFVADILPGVVARMNSSDVFVPSPWETLNNKIGGFRPGAVYVIAARPGDGKTVLAGQIATWLAAHGNVAFSSLEMTAEELVARFISEQLSINVGHVKDARMGDPDWAKYRKGEDLLKSLQIAVDDRSGISAMDVRMFARTVQRQGKLAAVVVDYMQLMVSKQKQDRHLMVAEFSRQLKILAKEFQVPVIALSQLNRNSVATEAAKPKLSDLRESGAIEQDADVVMLLRREGDYPNESLYVNVAKNRHGETGEVELHWDGQHSRVIEWADQGSAGWQ